jgi:hypothetical protein
MGDSAMANGGGTSPGEPNMTQAQEQPAISTEDREHLMRLRWLWETSYQIDCVGGTWTARRHRDPDVVLTADSGGEMWRVIVADNAQRKAETGGGGYWVERCSGPPYYVAPEAPPQPRLRNSG